MEISNYLKKFEQFLPVETRVRNVVIIILKEIFNITLERKKISVSGTKVFVNGPAVIKSEISLKQDLILKKIKETDPTLTITSIS